VTAKGDLSPEGKSRLARIEQLFGVKTSPAKPATKKEQSDASA
jgi:hypothetical protein